MNLRSIFFGLAVVVLICGNAVAQNAPAAGGGAATGGSAQIQFETPIFDFGQAQVGALVLHDYIFTNTGNVTLIVSNVEPKCGCTMTKPWTREVEPGKTGVIPIQFNSTGFNGPVTKYIGVKCNATDHPETILQMKGTVHTLIEAIPPRPMLVVISDAETNAMATVKIINHGEKPVTLEEPKSSLSGVAVNLKTVTPGKEFELELKTVPPLAPTNGEAVITMKTSNPQFPVVTVQALLFSRPALMITPSVLMVPSGPSTGVMTNLVRIYNLSTVHPLISLSDPTINVAGAGVKMREAATGKQFELMLTFPPGFEVPKGSNVEVTVKSTHPQFSLIRVPVMERPPDLAPRRPSAARPDGLQALPHGPGVGQP